jgi:diguanylate cyclase (GGDEF)-like protein
VVEDRSRLGSLISDGSRSRRVLLLLVFALVVFALSEQAVSLRADDAPVALWWPAAGVSAAAAVLTTGRGRVAVVLVVLASSGLANAAAGRPAGLALAFGVVNALEAAVVARVLRPGRGPMPELVRVPDLGRFLLAVAAGGATVGLLGGVAVHLLAAGDALTTARSVAPSHASALLLIVPAVLHLPKGPTEAGMVERALQVIALGGLLAFVFRHEQGLPLTVLPMLALIWAAARCSAVTVLAELAATAAVAATATLLGWGPFAKDAGAAVPDTQTAFTLVQVYVLVASVAALVAALTMHERRSALEQLRQLAMHDALTALPNRRLLLEELTAVHARAGRTGEPALLIALDLDGFKAVNDHHGHQAGDQVLVEIADRLRHTARTGDVVARVGGDEFLVLCPGLRHRSPEAAVLVSRLQRAVTEPLTTLDGRCLGTSIGTAPVRADRPMDLALHAADGELYADKDRRRARRPDVVELDVPPQGRPGPWSPAGRAAVSDDSPGSSPSP